MLGDLIADGMQEVRLAHSDTTVEKQGIIGIGGVLGYSLAGRVRQTVVRADHEIRETVAIVEAALSINGWG